VPDASERILRQVEAEAAHRRDLERQQVAANVQLEKRGQILAFVLALSSVAGGLIVIGMEKPLVGAAGALTAVGALVGLFMWSKARAPAPGPPRGPRQSDRR